MDQAYQCALTGGDELLEKKNRPVLMPSRTNAEDGYVVIRFATTHPPSN